MANETYDFSGWATRNNLKCSDGRVIMKDAFKTNDGQVVPLVWNHDHKDLTNVLGHALLQNRDDGVYAYCSFNNSDEASDAKERVMHGDIRGLSIYANQLMQNGNNVMHGNIREVSLVYASANPGAYIEDVIRHGEIMEDEFVLYTGGNIYLEHSDNSNDEKTKVTKSNDEETVGDVLNTLTEKQRTVVMALIGKALEEKSSDEDDEDENEGGNESVKHNLFENEEYEGGVLSHSDIEEIFADAKRLGSLRDSVIQHSATYGIDNIDYLFPDAKTITNMPEFIKRDDGWVSKVMGGVHHTPFSRIKSIFANITADEARAKGYTKGKKKLEEVFTLLKRSTTPQTIYKKQKLDRDDIVDITDFDVVAFLRLEMRGMLNEELARAVLVGDGRSTASDDKISEEHIRPIWSDDDLYVIKVSIPIAENATDEDKAKAFIKASIKARKDYKGSGNPTCFTTEDMLTDCLLIEDGFSRRLYASESELATAMRVKENVTVPVMENLTRTVDNVTHTLAGIIVNLNDYTIGADKGGEINTFEDFDIDYNQEKYLMETRCSGALTKPYSAIVLEFVPATGSEDDGEG